MRAMANEIQAILLVGSEKGENHRVDNVIQVQQAHLLSTCPIGNMSFHVNYDQFEIHQCIE